MAAALLFPALAAAELAGKPGCGALAAVYRSLEQSDAVSAAERRRITALILDACAVTEVRLARAATLDGVPVLEMPLRELRGGERRP